MFWKKEKRNQAGGDNSTNLQGEKIVITNTGLSYTDAKEIALDVFKANFLDLSENAAIKAKHRAEELVENFITKLQEKDPSKLERIEDPDMQYALFAAQREYARSGEKEMEDMLVNILLERIDENTQSLKKIVLNESLEVLPKLTNSQLDILTIVFLTYETRNNFKLGKAEFKKYLIQYFLPFIKNLTKEQASYKHLLFTGCCGSIGIPQDNISQLFSEQYKGVFSRGFEKSVFDIITNGDSSYDILLIQCINNPNLYQLNANGYNELELLLTRTGKGLSKFLEFKKLLDDYRLPVSEADKMIVDLVPEMGELIEVWRESYMCALSSNTVGIMLAYLNLKRKAGISINIDIWIK